MCYSQYTKPLPLLIPSAPIKRRYIRKDNDEPDEENRDRNSDARQALRDLTE